MNEHRLIAIKACIDNGLTFELSEKTISEMYNEIERLRSALMAIPNMPWSMVSAHIRQALEGETK